MPQVKLLIAEDEDNVRNSLHKYIKTHTTRISKIYVAANGQEAHDMITRYRPQLMLLDIQMPLKNGLEVMKLASASGVCPKTIILTGHDDFKYVQKALRYGAIDYFLKPFRSTEILGRLDDLAAKELPESESGEVTLDGDKRSGNSIVNAALEYMMEHYPEPLSLNSLAEQVGISPSYLSTLFTRTLGCNFTEYLTKIRIDRACEYFFDSQMRTYEIAYKVGFNNEKYFSNVFKRIKGKSPSEYKKLLSEGSI